MDTKTEAATLRRRARTPASKIDKAEQQLQVEAAVAEREAMRQLGEVSPLPDPLGRRRGDRFLRIVCGVDIRQREDAGTVTLEEFEWITIRREHLAEWQQRRRQRTAIRTTKQAAEATADGPVEVRSSTSKLQMTWSSSPSLRQVDDEQWRGRLRGPDDLRKLVNGRCSAHDGDGRDLSVIIDEHA